ncbi:GFA family protein [Tepidamorphus sp. 3E244]|uniref:GFA family protein n=1 Tax=Tepidamorphus sp. 3E244 TaxID=3385498 RepID=UPI0038FC6049
MSERKRGQCLCGNVHYEVSVADEHYTTCHCSMCRRWSGGPFMCVHASGDDVTWLNDTGLRWYRSSDWAERGFCATCGTSLFYRLADNHDAMLIVSVDSMDDSAGITLAQHIFVDHQPDRYAFADDAPRKTEAEVLAEFGVSED